ncbi:MAG: M48 family metallopeptidase, partial [Lachnospiraceae bacterium]|nr:M48 family metallopeptidase [Lachnospiraceae bacterium]
TRPYYVSNDEFYKFLKSRISWVKKTIKKVKVVPAEARISIYDLKNLIQDFIEKYELFMSVKVNEVKYRKMTSQWGSCSKEKGIIRFSTNLTKCNDRFIEYVVVHEMAHLIENNHSKRFWEIVKKYISDYKTIDKY